MVIGCFASSCINETGKCQPRLLWTTESNTELFGMKVRAFTAFFYLRKQWHRKLLNLLIIALVFSFLLQFPWFLASLWERLSILILLHSLMQWKHTTENHLETSISASPIQNNWADFWCLIWISHALPDRKSGAMPVSQRWRHLECKATWIQLEALHLLGTCLGEQLNLKTLSNCGSLLNPALCAAFNELYVTWESMLATRKV